MLIGIALTSEVYTEEILTRFKHSTLAFFINMHLEVNRGKYLISVLSLSSQFVQLLKKHDMIQVIALHD